MDSGRKAPLKDPQSDHDTDTTTPQKIGNKIKRITVNAISSYGSLENLDLYYLKSQAVNEWKNFTKRTLNIGRVITTLASVMFPVFLAQCYVHEEVRELVYAVALMFYDHQPFTKMLYICVGLCWMLYVCLNFATPNTDANSRTISTIHAIGVVTLVYQGWRDLSLRDTLWDEAADMTLGYLTFDFCAELWHMINLKAPLLRAWETFGHHVVGVVCILVHKASGVGKVYVMYFLLTEASTPLVNLRWRLSFWELRESRTYVATCLAMMIVFFFVRILPIPFFLYGINSGFEVDSTLTIPSLTSMIEAAGGGVAATGSTIFMIVLSIGLCVLNSFWFSLMVRMLMKKIKGSPTDEHELDVIAEPHGSPTANDDDADDEQSLSTPSKSSKKDR